MQYAYSINIICDFWKKKKRWSNRKINVFGMIPITLFDKLLFFFPQCAVCMSGWGCVCECQHFFPNSNLKMEFYVLASQRYTLLSAEFSACKKKTNWQGKKTVSFIAYTLILIILCIFMQRSFFPSTPANFGSLLILYSS